MEETPMANPQDPSQILDRRAPFDPDAEMGVLGSILLMPDVCDEVAPVVRPNDFHDDANRRLFEHMIEMHDAGVKIDVTLLVDRLKTAGEFEAIGGTAYLYKVSQSVPNAAHARYYARIVQEKATLRSLINASTDILRDAYDAQREPKHLVSEAEQKIFSILDNRGTSTLSNIRDILHEAMDRIEARMEGRHLSGAVETGFTDLDELTAGLHNSELVIVAARPSMGKTALAMNIAQHVTMELNQPVLFVSLEMSSIELADRMLCSVASVNGHRLRNGTISAADRQRLVRKAGVVSQAPLFVDDSPSRTVSEIAAAARRIRRQRDALGLIVVDYLQLIEPDNPSDPRQEQVAKIARRLKGLAREANVPVLCVAQLNRQAEDAKSRRPRLSHLRESGAIEQDADVVMFVHREEYFHHGDEKDQYEGQAELIIAKQRNGPVGTIELRWEKEFTRFQNLAPERLQQFDDYSREVAHADADDF